MITVFSITKNTGRYAMMQYQGRTDNCAIQKIFGKLILPYQAVAFPEIVPSTPIVNDHSLDLHYDYDYDYAMTLIN